ncbi:class I SAM-dependent methyltransferase [Streptomyces sp. VRA16 Mangrove soil]|uniref:class I SAM-dependent methyltransferase n=1 Tax=Streptomyces sp. VRA16 Mangrove soil TaxID=2817434 RepID=UPI001A9E5665|nr:class I SAM-dependent methyltransferase [Streptomyces sp. VRA16 Mangrove soil]MBO1332950.1 class I SAM-dependent methyltransferase [Streptomyces sp. VRA16 Mangrove soil]
MSADTAYHGKMGEHFAAVSADHVYNAHTDRPAMLRLAGDVTGRAVLDLGCGAGHYAAALAERGAGPLVGVDGSESMLAAARARLGDRATFRLHDLEEPLDFLPDASFDLALLALVYHHVDARQQLLAEIRRVLRPGGALLVSTTHPTGDWLYVGGSYFDDDRMELPIGDDHTVSYWRMTLEQFIGELLGAGFVLEELVEPRATEEARRVDERRYEKTHRRPTFLAVRLRRP